MSMDLFDYMRETQQKESPLASRMRPKTLDEVVGQKHIIGKNTMLYLSLIHILSVGKDCSNETQSWLFRRCQCGNWYVHDTICTVVK